MSTPRNPLELGPCCACRVRKGVGLVLLPVRGPAPGKGWGCVLCNLPADGAVAVVCDECGRATNDAAPILDVVDGYPASPARVLLETCTEPHEHDPARHALDVAEDGTI